MESKPPTLTPIYNSSQPGEFLTDRFGFIYDQRRKKRQTRDLTHRFEEYQEFQLYSNGECCFW
jgi:hypothetical protein